MLEASQVINRMTPKQRNSVPGLRLQLRVGLDSASTSDELGNPDEAIRTLDPLLGFAENLAEREDATVDSLRAAARVYQYFSYSVADTDAQKAIEQALAINKKCGKLLELEGIDLLLRLQLEREVAESFYFQNKMQEASASWSAFFESADTVLKSDESNGFIADGEVFSEWLHAVAGVAACEVIFGQKQDAIERLEAAWLRFEHETEADLHLVEASQGIWQLIDTALEHELVADAPWELRWLRRASNLIDQEAEFLSDGSLLEEQIQWKIDLLNSLKRSNATAEANLIEQQLMQLRDKESHSK